jgi:transcriptional regulator with XRE-family HTH domain
VTDQLRDDISSQIACLLKAERQKRRLSLNKLAQEAGLSRQTISFIEHEVQNPTLDTLLRIAAVLGIDLDRLIKRARTRAEHETGKKSPRDGKVKPRKKH